MFVAFEVLPDGEEKFLLMRIPFLGKNAPLIFNNYEDSEREFIHDFCNIHNIRKIRIVKFANREIIEEIEPENKG